jgi:hypothetical protein
MEAFRRRGTVVEGNWKSDKVCRRLLSVREEHGSVSQLAEALVIVSEHSSQQQTQLFTWSSSGARFNPKEHCVFMSYFSQCKAYCRYNQ